MIIKLNNYNVMIKSNVCNINNKIIELTKEDMNSLYRITREIKGVLPSEEYIYIEEDKKTYYINEPKPYTYIELTEFLGGLYDRC